jgi:predicted RNA-binding protein with PUA-like domain
MQEVAPDETALDTNHNGYDPKSTPETIVDSMGLICALKEIFSDL